MKEFVRKFLQIRDFHLGIILQLTSSAGFLLTKLQGTHSERQTMKAKSWVSQSIMRKFQEEILWQAQNSRSQLKDWRFHGRYACPSLSLLLFWPPWSCNVFSPEVPQEAKKYQELLSWLTWHSWVMDSSLWPGTEKTTWCRSNLKCHSWAFRNLSGWVIPTSSQRHSGA